MRPRTSLNHGEYGFARREKCPCEPCRAVVRRYRKTQGLRAHRGEESLVDATDAARRVQSLLDAGASSAQIGRAAGLAPSHVRRIPNLTVMFPATRDKIMAITFEQVQDSGWTYVNPRGVRRRLDALRRQGYTLSQVAEEIGVTVSAIHNLYTDPVRQSVRSTTLAAVDEVYRKWQHTEGPSERERWRAYRANLLPPAAWDDIDMDEEPDLSAVRCIVTSCHRSARQKSLCDPHHRQVFRDRQEMVGQRFKARVLALSNAQVHDKATAIDSIREAREMGFTTPAEVAARLGRRREHVERLWGESW